MSLPPDVRKHVALRLLESVDPDEAFDMASESWLRTEAAAAYDALKADPSRAIPAEDVRLVSRPSGPPVHDGPDQLQLPKPSGNSTRSTTGSPRRRRLTSLDASCRRFSTTLTASWRSRSPAELAMTSDRACGRPPSRRGPSLPTRSMSRPVSSWSTSSASSTVARTGRPRSATDKDDPQAGGDAFVRGKCVAGGPSGDRPRPTLANAFAQVSRTMPTTTVNGR